MEFRRLRLRRRRRHLLRALTHGGRAAQQEHWKIGELVLSFFFGEVLGRGMRRRTIARAVVGNREADELGDQRQEAVEVWEEQDVNSRR